MDLKTINKKLDDLEARKLEIEVNLANAKAQIATYKTQISNVEKERTVKGDELKGLIRNMNRNKAFIRQTKYHIKNLESEKSKIPNKITYYSRKKKNYDMNIIEWAEENYNRKLKEEKKNG